MPESKIQIRNVQTNRVSYISWLNHSKFMHALIESLKSLPFREQHTFARP